MDTISVYSSYLYQICYQRRSLIVSGLDKTQGSSKMTFDTLIGAIELCDFKVCNEAQNG